MPKVQEKRFNTAGEAAIRTNSIDDPFCARVCWQDEGCPEIRRRAVCWQTGPFGCNRIGVGMNEDRSKSWPGSVPLWQSASPTAMLRSTGCSSRPGQFPLPDSQTGARRGRAVPTTVDKPLDIHRMRCAEAPHLSTAKFLSNNRPAPIQCLSSRL